MKEMLGFLVQIIVMQLFVMSFLYGLYLIVKVIAG